MASHTIGGQTWPSGTTVSVYSANALPASGDGTPVGVAVTSAVVSGSSVTFSDLSENVRYLAYAAGVGKRFLIPQQDPMDARSLRSRVDELEGDTLPATNSRAGHPDRRPFIDITTGRYNCVDGDDITAELLDAITRYAPTTGQTGLVIYMPGNFDLSGQVIFPENISPLGAGSHSATRIRCTTSDAQFVIRSRGPLSGRFVLDGNSVASQPFYTDGVDRNFEDIEVLAAVDDAVVIENAQNNIFTGLRIWRPGKNGLIFRNGASFNRISHLRLDGWNEYAIKSYQTVNQGAAYPNGLSGTILAQQPYINHIDGGMIERIGTGIGGTTGVGLGCVSMTGGVLYFDRPNFSVIASASQVTDLPTIDIGTWDGFSTSARVEMKDVTGLGDQTRGVFARISENTGRGRLYIRGGFLSAYRAVYQVSDNGAVSSDMKVGQYINCIGLYEALGAKTYESAVRSSRLEPMDFQRPNTTDQAFTWGKVTGYFGVVRNDGIYLMDGTGFTPTNFPSIKVGNGSPEGAVSARIGSIYLQMDATAVSTGVWTKQSGTGTTGWVQGDATSQQVVATGANFAVANGGPELTLFTAPITADRTATLNALTAAGQRRTIVRTAASTGAFNLNVLNKSGGATIKALAAAGTWCDALWDGTDWNLVRAGAL